MARGGRVLERLGEAAGAAVGRARLVGLGSGATVAAFVRAWGPQARRRGVRVVASSLQIAEVASRAGLAVVREVARGRLPLVVDGADQVDATGWMVKGGGGALVTERVLHASADRVVILGTADKFVERLHGAVPVAVLPAARQLVARRCRALGGEPQLRVLAKGYPYVTEEGCVILDVAFGPIQRPKALRAQLRDLAGVVEVGLFPPADLYLKGDAHRVQQLSFRGAAQRR